jgi:hypothetical protein
MNTSVQEPSNAVGEPTGGSLKSLKGKAKYAPSEEDGLQPSQLVQTQMAARAKAQFEAAKRATELAVASEDIDLPEIRSEYSDSGDESQPSYNPPDWAQSPQLRQTLLEQSTINPDSIFGAIQPLRMEEIFAASRVSRFRARTSSANWAGADRLTRDEEREYARRMGFQ